MKITIPNWTCLLIPLKYMKNQEQSGQVQIRIVIFTCIRATRTCIIQNALVEKIQVGIQRASAQIFMSKYLR